MAFMNNCKCRQKSSTSALFLVTKTSFSDFLTLILNAEITHSLCWKCDCLPILLSIPKMLFAHFCIITMVIKGPF